MLYSDATELAIVQRGSDGRLSVGNIRCAEQLERAEVVGESEAEVVRCHLVPSVSGSVAAGMSRCVKAVRAALFSRTWGDAKAPMTEPWAGSTARARSKSAAVALATMRRSCLKVLAHFRQPNAILAL